MEGCSPAHFTFHPHLTAHYLAEPLADDQAQAGAAIFSRRRGIHLAKSLEKPVHTFGGNADAGVANGEVQGLGSIRLFFVRIHNQGDLALFSEFQRVVEHVNEDLPQAGDVADDGRRRARLDQVGQFKALLGRLDLQ